jgi:hypothetical protein
VRPPNGGTSRTVGWKAIAIGAVAILVVLGVVGGVLAASGGDEASAEELTLEPVSSTGTNPFAPSVGTDEADVTPPPSSGGSYSGDLEGLYGGTLNVSSCDPQKLVTFLQANPAKGRAWASTLGITFEQIPDYVSGLTPVILRSDTYVTNHGFTNGVANPIPAILQAGTAVLVDKYGVPVTKCYCGNPLTPPARCTKCTYTGPKWNGFSPGGITIINKSTTIIDIFVLVDPKTGEPFTRPPGTTGGSDTPGTTGDGGSTTSSSSTTLPPAPELPPEPPPAPSGPSAEDQAIARVQQAAQACYPFPAPIEDSTGSSVSTSPQGSYFVLQVVTDTTSGGHQTFTWNVDYATLAFTPVDELAQVASNHCSLLN